MIEFVADSWSLLVGLVVFFWPGFLICAFAYVLLMAGVQSSERRDAEERAAQEARDRRQAEILAEELVTAQSRRSRRKAGQR